jgi:hypothetical protein
MKNYGKRRVYCYTILSVEIHRFLWGSILDERGGNYKRRYSMDSTEYSGPK